MMQTIFSYIFIFILGAVCGIIAMSIQMVNHVNNRTTALCATCTLRSEGSCGMYHNRGVRAEQCNDYEEQGQV